MKSTYKLLPAAMLSLAACSTPADDDIQPATRTVTVNLVPQTRTTIGYEGSDVSHLEWCDGDNIAYVTDIAGDTFRKAVVAANAFKAEIPSNATSDNTIVALWPVAENVDKTLAEASVSLAAESTQTGEKSGFDGSLLPMYARAEIVAGNIDAEYCTMASVVRFAVKNGSQPGEVLKSVTLATDQNIVGSFHVDPTSDKGFAFSGESNSVTANITAPEGKIATLDEGETRYAYAVVPKGSYTGVTVTVRTDLDTYVFPDGAMDLSREDRALWRVELDLTASTQLPPEQYFTRISSADEITDDGTYLIVTAEAPYYTPGAPSKSDISYLTHEPVTVTDKGILKDESTLIFAWNIHKDPATGAYEFYSPYNEKYIRVPNSSSRNYAHIYLRPESTYKDPGGDYLFNIDPGSGTTIAHRNTQENTEMSGAGLKFYSSGSTKMFCVCRTVCGDAAHDVDIYKLRD